MELNLNEEKVNFLIGEIRNIIENNYSGCSYWSLNDEFDNEIKNLLNNFIESFNSKTNAEYRKDKLYKLYKLDWVAVEMARRKKAFHSDEDWRKISLFGLFEYKDIEDYLKQGKLINHLNFEPKNVTYWVIPSEDYYIKHIEPIVKEFTLEELQESYIRN